MIRPACFLDIPAILNLGYRYVEEEVKKVGYHSAEWDAEASAHRLAQSLTDGDFLWVAVHDGVVVGFLWAAIHAMAPWNNVPVASDFLFYLTPECRGSYVSIRLVKEYREWAGKRLCKEVRLSLASGINEERVGHAYKHLGFEPFGTVYCHKYKEE